MNQQQKAKAIARIQKALDTIPNLKRLRHGSPDFKKWQRNTELAIINTFGEESRHISNFSEIHYSLGILTSQTTDSDFQESYLSGLESASSVLQSMVEEINEYWENGSEHSELSEKTNKPSLKKEVFIIHGHDEGTKETIARFILKIGLTPIILHEQPNRGKTIIEKFEQHANVNFALALLTPDYIGGDKSDSKKFKPRARQNVIFEFGFFIGLLGRSRVCALMNQDIEIPSDYEGVIYIPLDKSEAWKMKLIKELKSAGIEVDANLAL
jgi:predicted nucleotide-binding protein